MGRKKGLRYRCENEFGLDPCEIAKSGKLLNEGDVDPSMDGGPPLCPGKTASGKTCGSKLVPLPVSSPPFRRWLLAGAAGVVGLAVLAGLVCLLTCGQAPILEAGSDPLVFPKSDGGLSTATLDIRNLGEGELVVDRIEAIPGAFSPQAQELRVAAGGTGTLTVNFRSPSEERIQGELVLHSNDPSSPARIGLIANQDPWWVYKTLERSSRILQEAK
jgi:hypothetical protein